MNDLSGYAIPVSLEARLFLGSCLLGLPIGLLLDIFRTLRALLPHPKFVVFLEDALLSLAGCVLLQLYATVFARDSLRWYFALGAALGLALYLLTIGLLWGRCLGVLRKILRGIARLVGRMRQKIMRIFVRNGKNIADAEKNAENA